jgi:tetratricopeptide (TPR) repeat protein
LDNPLLEGTFVMWKGPISLLPVLGLAILLSLASVTPTLVDAQDSGDADLQRQISDRFLQVLLRRPSPGTALDRVYGYHVQAGTLDQLMTGLETEAQKGGDDAGARFMLLGLLNLQRGNDAEAAKALTTAEGLREQDAMASYYLGKALLLVGRTDAAAEALERAIERKPARANALPVFTELGRLYQRSQQTDKALTVWQRLEATFPGDARVGEQIAQTLSEEGQDTAALERYQKLATQSASSQDYRSVGYQIAAAELKRRIGRDDEALTDLEKILNRLRPSSWLYADVRRRIEAGFLRSGDYAALADYYAVQVEKKPDEIELRMRLGRSLAKAGRLNEAETALTEAVKLAPENAETRLVLIDVFKSAGKADKAALQLEALVEQDSENPDYLVRLGNTWLDAQSLDKS